MEIYTNCVACCPLVSHIEYVMHAILRLERSWDRQDGRQTIYIMLTARCGQRKDIPCYRGNLPVSRSGGLGVRGGGPTTLEHTQLHKQPTSYLFTVLNSGLHFYIICFRLSLHQDPNPKP